MFLSTVKRVFPYLLIIMGGVVVINSVAHSEPVYVASYVTTASRTAERAYEPEVLSEASEDETIVIEDLEEPAPIESRYAVIADSITQEEKGLMALTVYHESRGEPRDGQRAVAETILNRVLSEKFYDASTVKKVIYQDGQFACAGVLTSAAIREPAALANCFDVVNDVLLETEYVIPAHYCFFSTRVPKTADYIQLGNHYFR